MTDAEYRSPLTNAIREATWCHCTNFTAEQGDALRLAWRIESERAQFAGSMDRALAEVAQLREERQAVLDCINLYGDETLHAALDAIGWPSDGQDGTTADAH